MNKKARKKPSYWFKRRRYGYGWVPVKPQGWASIILFLGFTMGSISLLDKVSKDMFVEFLIAVIIFSLLSVLTMIIVSIDKAPAPRWRWGRKPDDNPDEDF